MNISLLYLFWLFYLAIFIHVFFDNLSFEVFNEVGRSELTGLPRTMYSSVLINIKRLPSKEDPTNRRAILLEG